MERYGTSLPIQNERYGQDLISLNNGISLDIMENSSLPDFRAIFKALPGCYLILLPNDSFTIVDVSNAYLEATKTVREEILQKNLFTVFPDNPNDPHATGVANLTASLKTVLRTKKENTMTIQKYDIPRPPSEGGGFEERYWSPQNSPVLDGQGNVICIVHCVVDVTKQMKMEQTFGGMEEEVKQKTAQLYEANLFLDSIIEHIPNMIFVKDAKELRFLRLNRAGEELLGHSREELLGKNDHDFFPKEQADFFVNIDQVVLSGKMPIDIPQESVQTQAHGVRILHTTKVPVLNRNGEPEYLLGISEDITEHKRAQEELLEIKDRLQLAVESAQIGVWEWDIVNDDTVRSLRHDQIFGYQTPLKKWNKNTFIEHVLPDDRTEMMRHLDEGMKTGTLIMQCRVRWPDESVHWVEITGRLNRNEKRQPVKMFGIIRDITERKVAEEQAKEMAERRFSQEALNSLKFQQAVESSTDPIMITATDTTILYTNPAWHLLTGYSYNDSQGRKANILKTGKTEPGVFEGMKKAIAEGQPFHSDDIVNKRKDGTEYHADVTIYPVRDTRGNISFFVGIHKDITKKKESERIKTEFISLASHQLRTPLSAVRLAMGTLLREIMGTLNVRQKEIVEETQVYAMNMAVTIDTMLSVLRIEEGKIIPDISAVPFEPLCKKLKDSFGLECQRRKQKFDVTFDPATRTAADAGLLEEVLRTLLSNAIKYTPEGGSVQLDVAGQEKSTCITVRDTGIGIPRNQQQRMFEKFFRAENAIRIKTDGTGLGLYIAYALIKAMGGKLECASDENKGTTFTITLPLFVPPVANAA